MNTKDYQKAWRQTPMMRPKFELIKDIERGGVMHKKGTIIYGFEDRNTFTVPMEGNIHIPLATVKFIGYEDVRQMYKDTFSW